ncbi:MAG: stage 0 sporulation family protein [Bacilli bacterium]
MRVIGANFKTNGRIYYFIDNGLEIKANTSIIVETEKGLQYASVIIPSVEMDESSIGVELKPVIRVVTVEDEKKHQKNLADANKAYLESREIVNTLNLKMNILDASYTFDRNQLLFNFVAESRVDFRELAKKLAQLYHTRIELRQIGVRDKAKEVGGLGPCGRFLCCNSFLSDFASVSINMAKNQYIALNPTKINGVCGRLLCCLNYEDEIYTELKREMPQLGSFIDTPDGHGKVVGIDIFKKLVTVELKDRKYGKYSLSEVNNGSIT